MTDKLSQTISRCPDDHKEIVAYVQDAGDAAVQAVLDTPIRADDSIENFGRSKWKWIRLINGDLILGCFPHGDTYFATEHDRSI